MTNEFTAYEPASLPAPVLAYLDAHDHGRDAETRATFAPDATVLDDGQTYRGVDEIGAWIARSATEYEFTSTRIGQRRDDDAHVTVQVRIDGNFPGGTATLRYQFTLEAGLITRLAIEV